MREKISNGILILILCLSVILGGYLGYQRYIIETAHQTVELGMDLNDLKKMIAFEKKSLDPVLEELKKRGVTSLGVFEETLPDAHALGEIDWAKGSGVLALQKFQNLPIRPEQTYLYIPHQSTRKRIYNQLSWVLGKINVKFLGEKILEVNEAEEEIRNLGLGLSETQLKYLKQKGFKIIPRVWNDPRYHLGNIDFKVSALKDYRLIIFEGEEILGYPQAISTLAFSLKKNNLKYGYIEIVKQDGDSQLRNLMEEEVIRVHSIPKDELKKITKDEALGRFLRAVRERGVHLIYLRPFLPPQIDALPIDYNLNYLSELKVKIEKAGFVLGQNEGISKLRVKGWQVLILGLGVMVGGIFLLNYFLRFHFLWDYFILLLAVLIMVFLWTGGKELMVQKSLAWLAAIIFPSYAMISSFSRREKIQRQIFLISNIFVETIVGIFLMIGLLSDSRFMLGTQTFMGVKSALILPILMVASYFIFKEGKGGLKDKIINLLETKISLLTVVLGFLILAAMGIFVARSGNFVLPVPTFEKYFRNFLEMVFFVRPRTKEFLVGYPLLFLASIYFLKGNRKWLWLLVSLGTIAPISVFNSFSHIHTPILISVIRSINGLVLGFLVGSIVNLLVGKFIPNQFS